MKLQIISSQDKQKFIEKLNEAEEQECEILFDTFKAQHTVTKEWEGVFYCVMIRVPAGVTL